MTEAPWETVEAPSGSFISWGNTEGQHVTGKVVSYEGNGGTDFNGNICPQLVIELTEAAASISKEGERTDYPAGELVTLNIGQSTLKKRVQAADLNIGDLIKITLTGLGKATNGNNFKFFDVKVARTGQVAAQPGPTKEQAAAPF